MLTLDLGPECGPYGYGLAKRRSENGDGLSAAGTPERALGRLQVEAVRRTLGLGEGDDLIFRKGLVRGGDGNVVAVCVDFKGGETGR